MGNLRIVYKFLILLVASLAGFGLQLLISGSLVQQSRDAVEELSKVVFERYETSVGFSKRLAEVNTNLYRTISWTNAQTYDTATIVARADEQKVAVRQIQTDLEAYLADPLLDQEEKTSYTEIYDNLVPYVQMIDGVVSAVSIPGNANLATFFMLSSDAKYQLIEAMFAKLMAHGLEKSTERFAELQSAQTALSLTLYGATALIVLAMVLLIVTFTRSIVGPADRLVRYLALLANGQFGTELAAGGSDELGRMATSTQSLAASFRSIMVELKGTSLRLSVLGQSLVDATGRSLAAVNAIESEAQGVQDRANQLEAAVTRSREWGAGFGQRIRTVTAEIQEQSTSIAESSRSIRDMTRSIETVNQTVGNQAQVAQDLKALSDQGHTQMLRTTSSIQTMAAQARTILDMVKIIDDISSQTNILAMNAAIEAAHAGTAGRGFSVVALEIKKLSAQTDRNAKQISDSTGEILSLIEGSAASAGQTGALFGTLVERIGEVARAMDGIRDAMDHLSQGGETVAQAIDTIVGTTESIRSSGKDMNDGIGDILGILDAMETLSQANRTGVTAVNEELGHIHEIVEELRQFGSQNTQAAASLETMLKRFTL